MAIAMGSLMTIRKELLELVAGSSDQLSKFAIDIDRLYKNITETVSAFIKTDHPSYKVARKFLEKNSDGKLIVSKSEALIMIHTALYEVQDINTEIAIDIYTSAVEIHSLAKDIIRSKKTELSNYEKFMQLGLTKTDQVREIEFIMNNADTNFNRIDMRFKQIKNLIIFMEDQNSSLNRLDSALRLKQNIDSSAAFETIANGDSVEL